MSAEMLEGGAGETRVQRLAASGSVQSALSRRHFLWQTGGGFGAIALAWLLDREARAADTDGPRLPHYAPRAKRVLYIFCPGGVSHIDTFDYKPDLARHHGQELTGKGEIDTFFGQPGRIMESPWTFRRRGQSGLWVSDLLPHLATCVDQLTVIRSMVASTNNHTPAAFQMNSGFTMNGFPSMGAWLSYGLGSMNDDLPTYVVLPDPRGLPAGGSINWTAGFLPATHQGTTFRTDSDEPIVDLHTPASVSPAARQAALAILEKTNRQFAEAHPAETELAARLRSYELAARMQVTVPEVVDFADESPATHRLYGLDDDVTAPFGRNCLMARRLLERDVRFVQLWAGAGFGQPRINWDAHEDIVENHTDQAAVIDRPLAGLIKDLVQRGLMDDTLVVWCTEFGRTPITEGIDGKGRDHHPDAFTCFLAGAGVHKGIAFGASDEVGYFAVENPVTIHDFHATILHLLGLDHTRLTFYHNGIQRRLTDVHGHVVRGVLS